MLSNLLLFTHRMQYQPMSYLNAVRKCTGWNAVDCATSMRHYLVLICNMLGHASKARKQPGQASLKASKGASKEKKAGKQTEKT